MLNMPHTANRNRAAILPTVLTHLETGNEVLRTHSIRALQALAPKDENSRQAFMAALLDEDPDVRTDAMTALAGCARPEDAETIRQSLEGDPVLEVKLAAITILAALDDLASLPLIRGLAKARMDDTVAWEDDIGGWDEWLEVQRAAIAALAGMRATEAIDDLIAIRTDEFGQNLDVEVFAALMSIGGAGTAHVLDCARSLTGLARKRALDALRAGDAANLTAYVDLMLDDADAGIRVLAVPLLAASDPRVMQIAENDPDAAVRCTAISAFAGDFQIVAQVGLADDDESVQAMALEHLAVPVPAALHEALAPHMAVWIKSAGTALAAVSARRLREFDTKEALALLPDLIDDTERALEVRLAAVNGLAEIDAPDTTSLLTGFLDSASQQVRTVAARHLALRAGKGDAEAVAALAAAIDMTLLDEDHASIELPPEDGPDAAIQRFDDAKPSVRISLDGEIVEHEGEEPATGLSTLAAIQFTMPDAPEMAEDTPEEGSAKRRKRRSVEGPENIAEDLARVSLGLCGGIDAPELREAILRRTGSDDAGLSAAAYQALAAHCDAFGMEDQREEGGALEIFHSGLTHSSSQVRATSARQLASVGAARDQLRACLDDEDAVVRAIAVGAVATPQECAAYVVDPSMTVRNAALDLMFSGPEAPEREAACAALISSDYIDTVGVAIKRSPWFFDQVIRTLQSDDAPAKTICVLLQAIGACEGPAPQLTV